MYHYVTVTGGTDFNPRSHERSDNTRTVVIVVLDISIHAPTRGATKSKGDKKTGYAISIHAPTRGATKVQTGVRGCV